MSLTLLEDPSSLSIGRRLGPTAIEYSKTPSTPAIISAPVVEEEKDGYLVVKPAGAVRSLGHDLHWHGLGGVSPGESRFFHDLATGKKYGPPITVVVPIASKLAPQKDVWGNMKTLTDLVKFMLAQPREIQRQFFAAMAGDPKSLRENVEGFLDTLTHMPSWYTIAFKAWPTGVKKSIIELIGGTPDHDKTVRAIAEASEAVIPSARRFLDEIGATPGKVCVSGFSQGVGLAITSANAFSASSRSNGLGVKHAVLISSSYVETPDPDAPHIRNPSLKVDVILPNKDPVPQISGFTTDRIRHDLKAAFRGAKLLQCEGGHTLDGAAAELAGKIITRALRPNLFAETFERVFAVA